jgi:hypothetical protein
MGEILRMIKPILLTVHPKHIDYPLFRYNLKRYEKYFASLWFAMSNHHMEVDYTNFLMAQFPNAHFVDVKHTGSDWRNDAINETLDMIKTNEHILFIEQDFLWKDEHFLEKVLQGDNDFIYFTEGDRVHPAFALVSRSYIEQTSKDFSANPPKGDHFYKFFQELPSTGIYLEEFGVKNTKDYYHLNGLTQNYMNVKNDTPLYGEKQFLAYNFFCQRLPIDTHPQFYQIEKAITTKYGEGDREGFIKNFFPKI